MIPLWLYAFLGMFFIVVYIAKYNKSKGAPPNKDNFKLIIKYSLIFSLCFGLFILGDLIPEAVLNSEITFYLVVSLTLCVFAALSLAVGKKVAHRRFLHAWAIGMIGSILGVGVALLVAVFLHPLFRPGSGSDGNYGQGVGLGIFFLLLPGGIISSFFMGGLASLAGKFYDKKRKRGPSLRSG